MRPRLVERIAKWVEAREPAAFDNDIPRRRFEVLPCAIRSHFRGEDLRLDPGIFGIPRQAAQLIVATAGFVLATFDLLGRKEIGTGPADEDAHQEQWIQRFHSDLSVSANTVSKSCR